VIAATFGTAAQLAAPARATATKGPVPLNQLRDIALPGDATRFDYQSADPANRHLYIAHLGDSTVDVINLDTLQVVATIPHIADVHGVIAAPDLGRVFATATGSNELVTIDETTNREVTRTPTGAFPDGVAYDPHDKLVFVSNKDGGSLTVVDATTGHAAGTIKLANEVGNVIYDPTSHQIYAATRPSEQLAVIDPVTRQVDARIRLSGCDGAHGVYVNTMTRQAFIACENNARLVTVDLTHHQQIANTSIARNPDVLAYDPGLHRLYVASESGTLSVFTTTTRAPRKLSENRLANAAHTVAVDTLTHRVFFPLENLNGHPVLRIMQPSK